MIRIKTFKRISSDKNDKDFLPGPDRIGVIVRLNGKVMKDVLSADVDKGTVGIVKRDERGKLVHINGVVQEDTLHGSVTIQASPARPIKASGR